jgi:hypothetical protein
VLERDGGGGKEKHPVHRSPRAKQVVNQHTRIIGSLSKSLSQAACHLVVDQNKVFFSLIFDPSMNALMDMHTGGLKYIDLQVWLKCLINN